MVVTAGDLTTETGDGYIYKYSWRSVNNTKLDGVSKSNATDLMFQAVAGSIVSFTTLAAQGTVILFNRYSENEGMKTAVF